MDFKIGDKVQHVKFPMWGIIVEVIVGKKETTYKIQIEVGYLFATKDEITLAQN